MAFVLNIKVKTNNLFMARNVNSSYVVDGSVSHNECIGVGSFSILGRGQSQRDQLQYFRVLKNVYTRIHAHTCMHAFTHMYILLNVLIPMHACKHTCFHGSAVAQW